MKNAENSAGRLIACQRGLPAKPVKVRTKAPSAYFLIGGVEMLTYDIIKGNAVSPETITEACELIDRVRALEAALDNAIAIHGLSSLIEGDAA